MNGKKALELAILEYEKDLETDENNQWIKNVLKGLKEVKQDLEVLEILNNYSFIDTILKNNYVDIPCDYDVFIVEINSYYNKKHFDKVKEWLKK